MSDGEAVAPTPIPGGYCIKRRDDEHCIDLLKMLVNYRIVRSQRREGDEHVMITGGWCYFGHGVAADGQPRTMDLALHRAYAAALAWDGHGAPEGFDKEVFDDEALR